MVSSPFYCYRKVDPETLEVSKEKTLKKDLSPGLYVSCSSGHLMNFRKCHTCNEITVDFKCSRCRKQSTKTAIYTSPMSTDRTNDLLVDMWKKSTKTREFDPEYFEEK